MKIKGLMVLNVIGFAICLFYQMYIIKVARAGMAVVAFSIEAKQAYMSVVKPSLIFTFVLPAVIFINIIVISNIIKEIKKSDIDKVGPKL